MKQVIHLILFCSISSCLISQAPIFSAQAVHHPVVAKNGMVASQHPLASQAGLEIFYDVGYRFSFSASADVFGLGNFSTLDTFLQDNGLVLADSNLDSNNFSYGFEVEFVAHYQLTPQARFRFGYQGTVVRDLVSATDNVPLFVTSAIGTSVVDPRDSMIFQGVGFGLEIFRK